MEKKERILIVGAGLVGSLWALMLGQRGYHVEVYERRPDMRKFGFAGGRSINLAMSERGWRALAVAGVEEAIREEAIPMKGRMMHDLKGNLTFQPYGLEGQAIYSVSRAGLNLKLIEAADALGNVRFFFGHKCTRVQFGESPLLFFAAPEGQAIQRSADLVFGADGAFSAVRYSMQRTARFNYSQQYLEYGYKELSIPSADGGEHQLEKNALHIWPRKQFMLIALPNAGGDFTVTLFLPFKGENSFEQLQSPRAVRAFFEKWFPDALELMPDLEKDFLENPTGTLMTVRCRPWQKNGNTLLMGDAAHAIVPFYGQGMISGFEDCRILNDMLEEGQSWSDIIQTFSDSRPKDTNAIADLALRNFVEMRDLVADPTFLLRKKLEKVLHQKYPERFLPVYSMVSFSHIPYAKALEEQGKQDALFERILAHPQPEAVLDDEAFLWGA